MKALEKLREYQSDSFDLDERKVCEIADEIEREIAERYMELPVDADGVPIRVGDTIERDEDGFCVIGVAPKLCFVQDGLIAPAKPMYYRHVKPRTLEDVLVDMLETAVGYSDAHTTVALGAVERYAAEIRELLGGEGE